MKILLLGKNGQLGWELQRSLSVLGPLTALGSSDVTPCGNFLDVPALRTTVRTLHPDVIVNASAYTAVDRAETDTANARVVNTEAVAALADEAKTINALFVHFSTDYVFDGSGSVAWTESDTPNPLNVYGLTKWHGEQAIQSSGCRHWIFRTSWVYGSRGKNFARTILKAAADKKQLRVINDQFGAPTGADLLADCTLAVLGRAGDATIPDGVFHLAASGETTWFDYASFLVQRARERGIPLTLEEIVPVPSSEYSTPARRPLNSRLDTSLFRSTFNLHLPHWQVGVSRMLEESLPF